MIQIKRIYEAAAESDGFRVLVDRLWPRGISKERAAIDLWLKDVAPSGDLRTWFGHKPERFAEFSQKYEAELDALDAVTTLVTLASEHKTLTLLYGAKDPTHNHALVLQSYIEHRMKVTLTGI